MNTDLHDEIQLTLSLRRRPGQRARGSCQDQPGHLHAACVSQVASASVESACCSSARAESHWPVSSARLLRRLSTNNLVTFTSAEPQNQRHLSAYVILWRRASGKVTPAWTSLVTWRLFPPSFPPCKCGNYAAPSVLLSPTGTQKQRGGTEERE